MSNWCPDAWYGKEAQTPISTLALWDRGYAKPCLIASSAAHAQAPGRRDLIETIYRWRMRLECTNRDQKTGVILREDGDQHVLKSVLHVHRLLLALAVAEWLLFAGASQFTTLGLWQSPIPYKLLSLVSPYGILPV